jgi:HEPN domain-containing protein
MSVRDSKMWIDYAQENLDVAKLVLAHGHYNASLQNAQQAVEKFLKAVILSAGKPVRKTHDLVVLLTEIASLSLTVDLDAQEALFINSIYVLSKYPLEGVLPDSLPDEADCRKAIEIAERVGRDAKTLAARDAE